MVSGRFETFESKVFRIIIWLVVYFRQNKMLTGLVLSLALVGLRAHAQAASTITTAEEFNAIRNTPSGSYILGADIILDSSYVPIPSFTGSLDGANHKLTISGQTGSFGVFGDQFSGSVHSLKLSFTATISGPLSSPVGTLIGVSTGSATVDSVFVEGTMTLSNTGDASITVGGVIGSATETTTLRNITSEIAIACTGGSHSIGGVVGSSLVGCTECFYGGTISAGGAKASVVGGIFGTAGGVSLTNSAMYKGSLSTTSVATDQASALGALVGNITATGFTLQECYAEFTSISLTSSSAAYLGGLIGSFSLATSKDTVTISNSYVNGSTQTLSTTGGLSTSAGFLGYAASGKVTVTSSYVNLSRFAVSGSAQVNATLSVGTANQITGLTMENCYLSAQTVDLSGGTTKSSFSPIANVINVQSKGINVLELESRIGSLTLSSFTGLVSLAVSRFVTTTGGKLQDCFTSLDSCSLGSTPAGNTALFYAYVAGNAIATNIIANVSCAAITNADSGKSNASITYNYFNSGTAGPITSVAGKYIGLTDSDMRLPGSYTGIDTTVWNIDGSHYPHLKRTPHYRDGSYIIDDRAKWTADVWEIGQSMRLKRTNPPASCDSTNLQCSTTQYVDVSSCQCVEGCPGLVNGQCIGPNKAKCNPGFKLDQTNNCLIYSCITAIGGCPLTDGSSGATCNTALDVCACADPNSYYDHTSKTCISGCTALVGGICTGSNEATCYPGWVADGNSLCAKYDCSTLTESDSNVCSGPSVATCDSTLKVCVCRDKTQYYDPSPANPRCITGCSAGVQYGVCSGSGQAVCIAHVTSVSGATSQDVLCTEYSCDTVSCGAQAECNSELKVCLCPLTSQYYDIEAHNCVAGCSSLAEGICVGQNRAKCRPGYSSQNGVLCGVYSCANDQSSRKCGGLGTCENGSCVCNQQAVLFRGSCKEGLCRNGNVVNGVCQCLAGWSSPTTDEQIEASGYCSIYTCPSTGTVIDLATPGSLMAIKACPSHSFRLTNDILARDYEWEGFDFSGSLDGNNHMISEINLRVSSSSSGCSASFFKQLTGQVRNVQLVFASSPVLDTVGQDSVCKFGLLSISTAASTVLENVIVSGSLSLQVPATVAAEIGGVFHTCPSSPTDVINSVTVTCAGANCTMGGYCHTVSAALTAGTSTATLKCQAVDGAVCIAGGFAYTVHAPISNIISAAQISLVPVSGEVTQAARVSVGGIAAVLAEGASASDCQFSGYITREQGDLNPAAIVHSGGAFYMVNGTSTAKVTIEGCTVTSDELSGIGMAGFVGTLINSTVRNCSAIATKIDGLRSASGFAQYVNDSVITNSFVKANVSITTEGRRMVGGFCGLASNAQISNTYAEIGNFSSPNTLTSSSIGGFVGRVENSVIRDSFVRANLLEATSLTSTSSQWTFGGFAGFIDQVGAGTMEIQRCFGDISNLSMSTVGSVYLGAFGGQIRKRSSTRATSKTISNVWINANVECTFSVPEDTSKKLANGVGMFAGKMYNGVALSLATINGSLVCRGANPPSMTTSQYYIGLFNGAKTSDTTTSAEFVVINVTVSGVNGIGLKGAPDDKLVCSTCFANSDLLTSTTRLSASTDPNLKTSEELRKVSTYSGFDIGTTGSKWTKSPGEFPFLNSLPALVPVDNQATYIYPACTQDCWDYTSFWVLSPSGPTTDDNKRHCANIANCMIYANNCMCSQCNLRYYFDGSACVACSSGCQTCRSADFCEICENGQVSNGVGVCIAPSCDFLYCGECSADNTACTTCSMRAFKAANGQCEKCGEGCKQCTGATACTSCGDGNYKPSPENGVCTCKDGFYSSESKCLQCNEACQTCTGGTAGDCTACSEGWTRDEATGTCTPQCAEVAGCLLCPNPPTCGTCRSDYILVNGQCVSSNTCMVANCLTCVTGNMNACASCKDGFYGSSCAACPERCSACDSSVRCTACKSGYALSSGGQCVTCSVSNCNQCSSDNTCSSCTDGYYLNVGQCSPCNKPCRTCVTNADKCTSCQSGYELSANTCISTTACDVEHCRSCISPGVCGKCDTGYYVSSSRCSQCNSMCRECYGPNTCTECAANNAIPDENGICVSIVCNVSNCIRCDLDTLSVCTMCDSGYTLSSDNTCSLNTPPANKNSGMIAGVSVFVVIVVIAVVVVVVILFKKGVIGGKRSRRAPGMSSKYSGSMLSYNSLNESMNTPLL